MLNVLTETSFNVRLLTVNYVDEDRKGKVTTRLGFFIEHKDRLARRLNAELIDTPSIDRTTLEPAFATLAELYQYLLSNTDYSFIRGPANDKCCHNAVPMAVLSGEVIPIPYDFDVTGFVDAPYAMPVESLQRDVTDRVYRGFCRPAPHQENAYALMQAKRETLYAVINDLEGLNDKNLRQATKFVDRFYKTLDDPKAYQRKIVGACRG